MNDEESNVLIRIKKRCQFDPITGCLEWQGASGSKGHGRIKVRGKLCLPHRLVLAAHVGRALAPGELACHHCDNPRCVTPEHLFVGSSRDNAMDAVRKGRMSPLPHDEKQRAAVAASNRQRVPYAWKR